MSESELYGQIMRAHSRGETRLFRQQAGLFWTGKIIEKSATLLVLANPRAVHIGVPGMPDLGGFTSRIITAADVGKRVAIYVGIEGKAGRNKLTAVQANFIHMVTMLGGFADVARSVADSHSIITRDLK